MQAFRRKCYGKLLDWKQSSRGRTAVMIDGARRVGKTWLATEFARREYDTSIVVDFSKADSRITSAIRDRASDLDAFFTTLSLVSGTRLHPRRSAIVFDEVQLFPPARQMIKHLVADGRYDYIETGSLISYRDDIAKFAKGYEARVRALFDAIPEQLSRKEKKYRLSSIRKEARFREYEDAFTWLDDARVVNPCLNATEPTAGLGFSAEHATQKLYMGDTGLLVTHAYDDGRYMDNALYREIFFGNAGVNNGMVAENAVAQAFRASGRKLFFYSRADPKTRKNSIEIDFLLRRGGRICPVEVKSGNYRSHASLDKFRAKFGSRLAPLVILYTKDVMQKDGILHLPLYMAMFL